MTEKKNLPSATRKNKTKPETTQKPVRTKKATTVAGPAKKKAIIRKTAGESKTSRSTKPEAAKNTTAAPAAIKETASPVRIKRKNTEKTSKPRRQTMRAKTTPPGENSAATQEKPGATAHEDQKKRVQSQADLLRSFLDGFSSATEQLGEHFSETAKVSHSYKDVLSAQHTDYSDEMAEAPSVPTTPTDPFNISELLSQASLSLVRHPEKTLFHQMKLWQDYMRIAQDFARIAPDSAQGDAKKDTEKPGRPDRRFADEKWDTNLYFKLIHQLYEANAKALHNLVTDIPFKDEKMRKKAAFFARQYIDALSPTNFLLTNPEVLDVTLATGGGNLVSGMQNYLKDLRKRKGSPYHSITQADESAFILGKDIAATPGDVIYKNRLIELIQYAPATSDVGKNPVLIIPPWINKYYILDLQEKNSFVRWLVGQGRTVFMVSWVNPDHKLADLDMRDYLHEGIYAALEATLNACLEAKKADVVGFCIGGTLLACALAHMAARDDTRFNTATFLTTQTDFTDGGDLSLFVDDALLENIEKIVAFTGGVMDGRLMAATFNMLRSNDLIWSFFVENYLKGKPPRRFDILHWNADNTHMPRDVYLTYLRKFYKENALARKAFQIDGITLELDKVRLPVFSQSAEKDHIAPPDSVYRGARLFGGPVEFVLAGSGHVAGVVNPPAAGKYHYNVNQDLPQKLGDWKAKAIRHQGSWWPYWLKWIEKHSPERVSARKAANSLAKAPGEYVRLRG